MTIIYQYRVATTSLGGFLKLLRAWKGSVYKLLYKEIVIFLALYASISLVYRLALSAQQRTTFESIVIQMHQVTSSIPLSFVLGFYVTVIVQRWWQQFSNIPWPDRTLFVMTSYLHGSDDKARMMRRSVARYMLFSFILITRTISIAVMKRFPTLEHIVEAGFISKEESELYESTPCQYLKFWVPLMWANNVLVTARREGRLDTDFGLRMVLEQLADFRDKCSHCFVYDWITVPLVYTQVVTFAVYSYFAACLVGHQYLDPSKQYDGFDTDFYVPGFTILQFLFYMGWLKVAEQMINPFGEDDDDYDINWLLDRHTAVAFSLVDYCYGRHPPLARDPFWNDVAPDVPYTESSLNSVRPNFLGSTFNVARPSIDVERMLVPDHEELLHPHLAALRQRSKGSFSGSLLSLLPFRHRHHGNGDSRDTLASNGSSHGRFLSIPNARTRYNVMPNSRHIIDGDARRRSSFDMQRRERANTDYHPEDSKERERKLSLPFSLGLPLTNKQASSKKTEVITPPSPKLVSSRFSVEPVKEPLIAKDSGGNSDNTTNKTRRSGHANVTFQNGDKVSRIPILSAIEEGNTITSLRQVPTNHSLVSYDDDDDDHDDNNNNDNNVENNNVISNISIGIFINGERLDGEEGEALTRNQTGISVDDANGSLPVESPSSHNDFDECQLKLTTNHGDYDDGVGVDDCTFNDDNKNENDVCLSLRERQDVEERIGEDDDKKDAGEDEDEHNDDDVFIFGCSDRDWDLDLNLDLDLDLDLDQDSPSYGDGGREDEKKLI